MKALVLNGSPAGDNSITLQTALYIEKLNPDVSFSYLNVAQRIKSIEKDFSESRKIALVTDCESSDYRLQRMTDRFAKVFPGQVEIINLKNFPFAGGCLGCFHCASDGVCVYKDGFDSCGLHAQ